MPFTQPSAELLENITVQFEKASDPSYAGRMENYMRNQFAFYGIPSPERKVLSSAIIAQNKAKIKTNWREVVELCWREPKRELQYFAQELAAKHVKSFEKEDIALIEMMITQKSWWDTVDFVASNLAGAYYRKFPEEIAPTVRRWMNSGNLWLCRTCLLFQLKYGLNTDTGLLFACIGELGSSRDFFIRKAIGWSLRQLSKTNPDLVIEFVNKHKLPELSRKEALKIISKSR